VHRDTCQGLLDGALAALTRLRERFDLLALVTNGASIPQRAKIERFELTGFFDHIQVEGEFGRGKPDPEVYAHVFDVLGVRADESLMVGDNFGADVIGALDAGAHAVWIDRDAAGRPPSVPPRPHASVRSLAEWVEQLGRDSSTGC
jgi:putative hydrolase of the HAD superfamily